MSNYHTKVRQQLAAALASLPFAIVTLVGLPTISIAEPLARYDEDLGTITVSGLTQERLQILQGNSELIYLQLEGSESEQGMLVSSSSLDDVLIIQPRFNLSAGQTYRLALSTGSATFYELNFAIAATEVPAPRLVNFSPSHRIVPENTLRFYLTFSEPMAVGQVRERVRLQLSGGEPVESPFLNLATELWDSEQRRLTLLLDPGRIKQGVGPNIEGGAPLVAGNDYRLVVSAEMVSAAGEPLGQDIITQFSVSSAQRSAIDPSLWSIIQPQPRTREPFFVSFDRVMDQATVQRLLRISGSDGETVQGSVDSDGTMWTLTPERPWIAGGYRLIVEPDLEDVAGNTIRSAFDASAGTIGATTSEPSFTPFEIR